MFFLHHIKIFRFQEVYAVMSLLTFFRSAFRPALIALPAAVVLLLSGPLAGYCGEPDLKSTVSTTASQRPATWATPVSSENLKNFYKIDEKVYRSAQPNKKGFQELKTLGIRNVLSFRDYHSDDDGKNFGLNLYRVKMEAGDITTDQVTAALRIIRNAEGPVLIHCWHGSDRTGLVSAMYRIVLRGWSKDEAIDELMHGGYGYHSLYKNIPEFIRQANIEEIRKQVLAPQIGAQLH